MEHWGLSVVIVQASEAGGLYFAVLSPTHYCSDIMGLVTAGSGSSVPLMDILGPGSKREGDGCYFIPYAYGESVAKTLEALNEQVEMYCVMDGSNAAHFTQKIEEMYRLEGDLASDLNAFWSEVIVGIKSDEIRFTSFSDQTIPDKYPLLQLLANGGKA